MEHHLIIHIIAGVSSIVNHKCSQGTGLKMYTSLNQQVIPLQPLIVLY